MYYQNNKTYLSGLNTINCFDILTYQKSVYKCLYNTIIKICYVWQINASLVMLPTFTDYDINHNWPLKIIYYEVNLFGFSKCTNYNYQLIIIKIIITDSCWTLTLFT